MAALLQIRWPPTISARYLKTLAPRAGFDLATNRLKGASSAIACIPLRNGAEAKPLKLGTF